MTDTITISREDAKSILVILENRWSGHPFIKTLKAALAAPQRTIPSDQDVIENLMTALQWYADGNHFDKADPDAWDTVSGEPQNWWCDEAGTAMVEDGSLAAMVLQGKLTGAQLQAMEDGEVFEPTPEPQPTIEESFTVAEQSRELDAGMAAQHYCRGLWGAARGHSDWRKVHEHFANGYKQGVYDNEMAQGPNPYPDDSPSKPELEAIGVWDGGRKPQPVKQGGANS